MHQKLVDIPHLARPGRLPPARRSLTQSAVSLSRSYVSFRTFQESDAEKSDQDLVVDVANEVRYCEKAFIHKVCHSCPLILLHEYTQNLCFISN